MEGKSHVPHGEAISTGRESDAPALKPSSLSPLSGLRYNAEAGILVCVPCQQGFSSVKSLRAHWRHKHALSEPIGVAEIRKDVLGEGNESWGKTRIPKCLGGLFEVPIHKQYQTAPECLSRGQSMPVIDGISVEEGWQCELCNFCHNTHSILKIHVVNQHGIAFDDATRKVDNIVKIPIQSIGLGKSCLFFPVASLGGETADSTNDPNMATQPETTFAHQQEDEMLHSLKDRLRKRNPSSLLDASRNASRNEKGGAGSNMGDERDLVQCVESISKEVDLFVKLCGTQIIFRSMGFKSLSHIPIELTASPEELWYKKGPALNLCEAVESTFFAGTTGGRKDGTEGQETTGNENYCYPRDWYVQEKKVRGQIRRYLSIAGRVSLNVAQFVKRAVRPSDGDGSGVGRAAGRDSARKQIFSAVTDSSTIDRYALVISRLVLVCVRLFALESVLQVGTSGVNGSSTGENDDMADKNPFRKLTMDDGVQKATEQYVKSCLGSDRTPRRFDSATNVARNRQPSSRQTADTAEELAPEDMTLHILLRSILLCHLEHTSSTQRLFVRTFLALSSVESQGSEPSAMVRRFRSAKQISPITAALMYGASICGMLELVRGTESDPFCAMSEGNKSDRTTDEESQGLKSAEDTQMCISKSQEMQAMTLRRVKVAFNCAENTAVSYIGDIYGKAIGIQSQSTPNIRFLKCLNHSLCGIVNGKELQLKDLCAATKEWAKNIDRTVETELLFGLKIPNLAQRLGRLSENFMMEASGANFSSIPENKKWCSDCSMVILDQVWETPHLRHAFFSIGSNCSGEGSVSVPLSQRRSPSTSRAAALGPGTAGQDDPRKHGYEENTRELKVSKTEAERYLSKCQDVLHHLLALMHATSGGTARATEISTYLLENTDCAMRSVFSYQGRIAIIGRYSKTQSATGRNKVIARFPDPTTSLLFFKYILFVRPFEVLLVESLYGDKAARSHAAWLLSERGNAYSDNKIRSVINKVFASSAIPLSFSEFRHYQCAIMRHFLSYEHLQTFGQDSSDYLGDAGELSETFRREVAEDLSLAFPIHEQAGHTRSTANSIYAISKDMVKGLDTFSLLAFFRSSQAWQRLLCQPRNEMIVAHRLPRIGYPLIPPDGFENGRLTTNGAPIIYSNPGKDVSFELDPPAPQGNECKSFPNAGQFPESTLCQPQKKARTRRCESIESGSGYSKISLQTAKDLRVHLKRMLRSEKAEFKSQTQLEAVVRALQKMDDLLIIMPTGAGKSLVYMLPCFIEGTRSLTIVVVPLVALMNDLAARCRIAGLRTATWDERDQLDLQILIVSVEHVQLDSYRVFVAMMSNTGRLSRFVIEEVHLTGRWSSFRPVMSKLGNLLCPTTIPVPTILLSATVTPAETETIGEQHGLRSLRVLRMPTRRPNLKYSVIRVTPKAFENVFKTLTNAAVVWLRNIIAALEEIFDSTFIRSKGTSSRPQIILYCPSRCMAEEVMSIILRNVKDKCLSKVGEVLLYHAKLDSEVKSAAQSSWMKASRDESSLQTESNPESHIDLLTGSEAIKDGRCSSYQVMVSTCAFGTGIDSPNVRAVLHVGFSRSLSEYAQESGRAGRDGMPALCVILYSKEYAEKNRREACTHLPESVQVLHIDSKTLPALDMLQRAEAEIAFGQFQTWAESEVCCRRQSLFSVLDEAPSPICLCDEYIDRRSWCDICDSEQESHNLSTKELPGCESPGGHMNICEVEGVRDLNLQRIDGSTCANELQKGATGFSSTGVAGFQVSLARNNTDSDKGKEMGMKEVDRCTPGFQTTQPEDRALGTTKTNFDQALRKRAHITEIIQVFRLSCKNLQELCIVCLVSKGERHDRNDKCIGRRCFRCLQRSHFSRDCKLLPYCRKNGGVATAMESAKKEGLCYACGLCHVQSFDLHEDGEFGQLQQCPFVSALQAGLMAWSTPRSHVSMVETFGLQSIETGGDDEGMRQLMLLDWLREMDRDGRRLNLMHFVDFMLA